MLLTDVQAYDSDVLHLSISTKTYWWRQLLSNGGNLFVHILKKVKNNIWNCFFKTENVRNTLDQTGAYVEDTERNVYTAVARDEGEFHREEEAEQNTNVQHFDVDDEKRNETEISQASNSGDDSPLEGTSVVRTKLPPGKVETEWLIFNCVFIEDFKRLIKFL